MPMPLGRPGTVAALGTAQTLAWASTYYLPAILAAPMARELGVAMPTVFAAFSVALVVSALFGPGAGAAIDRWGGRPVLMTTSVVFALGLAALGSAQGPVSLFAAWVVWGLTWALSSGAAAAYLFDLSQTVGARPARSYAFVRAAGQVAILLSLVTAGPLYSVDRRLPFAVTAGLSLLAALLILALPRVDVAPRLRVSASVAELRRTPVALACATAVLVLAFGWSVQILYQPVALALRLDETRTGWMYAGLAIAGVLGALAAGRTGRPARAVVVGAAVLVVGVCGAAYAVELAPVIWLPVVGFGFALSWTSAEMLVSSAAPSGVRATALSLVSMCAGVFIAVARPGLGLTSERWGPDVALGAWGAAGLLVLAALVWLHRKRAALAETHVLALP